MQRRCVPRSSELGLDAERFIRDLRNHAGKAKIAADVDSADLSGVSGTPTFFINGKRHALRRSTGGPARALITSRTQPRRVLISSPALARSGRPATLPASSRCRASGFPA